MSQPSRRREEEMADSPWVRRVMRLVTAIVDARMSAARHRRHYDHVAADRQLRQTLALRCRLRALLPASEEGHDG